MNSTLKKWICAFFAFLTIFSFSACHKDGEKTVATEPAETDPPVVEDPTTDDLGDIQFPGRTVRFLVRGFPSYANELFVDEGTSDTIGFEVYKRQLAIQERFNLDIAYTRTAQTAAHGDIQELKAIVMAGNADGFDVYSNSSFRTCPASLEGNFIPYDDIDYVNLNKSYWADYYIREANIGDKTYVITGSAALTTVKLMACTFFNQKLIGDLELEDPYTLVENQNWTIAKLNEISTQIYDDKNGNGVADALDLYGLSYSAVNGITVDAFTSAFDLNMIQKDEDGTLKLVVDKNRFQTATEALTTLMWADSTWHDGNFKAADQGDCVNFANDLRVFLLGAIYMTEYSSFVDMKSEYGILPYPKLDQTQEEYYSYVEDQVSVFAIVQYAPNADMIGAVLEAMGAYSHRKVMPTYYDILLKGRYLRDPESAAIIDMMVANIKVDAAWCYDSAIKGLGSLMRTLVESKYPYFISSYDGSYDTYKKYVDDLIS